MKISEILNRLVQTYEVQRMKDISSLGAKCTHPDLNRYAHSKGACKIAMDLIRAVNGKLERQGMQDTDLENALYVAALLHDVGHAPLSHSFERIAGAMGVKKDHEDWSQEIILGDTDVNKILCEYSSEFPHQVADMLFPKNGKSFYHLLASSQFDVDRIDYLKRDSQFQPKVRGDFDYNKLKYALIPQKLPDGTAVITFDYTAEEEVKNFLLCRFVSYRDNYTSEKEASIEYKKEAAIMKAVHLPSNKNHPLVRFFEPKNQTLKNYLSLRQNEILSLADGYYEKMHLIPSLKRQSLSDDDLAALEKRVNDADFKSDIYSVSLSCLAYNPKKNPIYIKTEKNGIINFGDLNENMSHLTTHSNFMIAYSPKTLSKEQILTQIIMGGRINS